MKRNFTAASLCLFILFLAGNLTANPRTGVNRFKDAIKETGQGKTTPYTFYQGDVTSLAPAIYGGDYIIGPEINTALNGFYDWQTNGDCKHHLNYISSSIVHACYMIATDSSDINASRRTGYSFSTDGGQTWSAQIEVPVIRSGYPSLTVGITGASNNVAIIGNHLAGSGTLVAGIFVDAFPGIGSFTQTNYPANTGSNSNFIWPQLSTFTNGNLLVAGETYQGAAATDTGVVARFDPNAGSWVGTTNKFVSSASSQLNMRWTSATGPNGRGIYVLTAITDVGGPFGGNRIFYWTTTDNGATWSSANTLFETSITGSDTNSGWLGVDAVYDNSGNFYVAFNTTSTTFSDSKLWVSKNGAAPVMVVEGGDIPGFASTMIASMANVAGVDWPSLSVSEDGLYLFVAFSVTKLADTLNGYNSMDIYYTASPTAALVFPAPVQVTSGINDERYVSLNRKAFLDGGNTYKLPLVYQKDPQPGSAAFNDLAPISRARLIYREITQAQVIGIQNVGSEIPGSYSLKQNYPNPFNPSTSIEFALPVNEKVTLKVFDISGKEVAVLLNGESVSAGLKKVDFNASYLSSGIYFYTIKAGSFTETKKMSLLK